VIRAYGTEHCWLTVVSAGRPQNVPVMEEKIGPATWYVPLDELAAYMNAATRSRVEPVTEPFPACRNVAISEGTERDLTTVQLDDDLRKFRLVLGGQAIDTTADVAIQELLETVALSDFKLGGVAPTSNPFFSNEAKPVSSHLFVPSACIAVKPNCLTFDPSMPLKADYDYTIRQWMTYGGVCRLNLVLPEFAYATNPGGCNLYRTPALVEQANRTLIGRYPKYVRPNPRRPGEVLLRLPRASAGLPL